MLTQKRLRQLLLYNKETGVFVWNTSRDNSVKKDDTAGSMRCGYVCIRIDSQNYSAHRLVWLYLYGKLPIQIDHINGIKNDNRIINLREVDCLENNKNKRLGKNNTSGYFGITWNKTARKWRGFIKINGKNKHLGYFTDKKEAIKTRKMAESKYGYHENHGKVQENKLGLIKCTMN